MVNEGADLLEADLFWSNRVKLTILCSRRSPSLCEGPGSLMSICKIIVIRIGVHSKDPFSSLAAPGYNKRAVLPQ